MKTDNTAAQTATKQKKRENVQTNHKKTMRIARQRAKQRKEVGTYNSPKIPEKMYDVTIVYHPNLYDQIKEIDEQRKKDKKKYANYSTESYCYIAKVSVDELAEINKDFGACEIKIRDKKIHPHVMSRKWVDKTPKETEEKKPTVNTTETKRKAKTNRKNLKLEHSKMRAYYAARRNGGVSKRLEKKNPKLAEDIKKWLKDHPAVSNKRKNRGSGVSMKCRRTVTHRKGNIKPMSLVDAKNKKNTNLNKAA